MSLKKILTASIIACGMIPSPSLSYNPEGIRKLRLTMDDLCLRHKRMARIDERLGIPNYEDYRKRYEDVEFRYERETGSIIIKGWRSYLLGPEDLPTSTIVFGDDDGDKKVDFMMYGFGSKNGGGEIISRKDDGYEILVPDSNGAYELIHRQNSKLDKLFETADSILNYIEGCDGIRVSIEDGLYMKPVLKAHGKDVAFLLSSQYTNYR